MVAPYLIYVAAAGGLSQYLADGLQFSEREADRTLLGFPGFGDAPLWSPDALSVVGYYAFWITPVVAALVAWAAREGPPRTRLADRWVVKRDRRDDAGHEPGLLRDPLTVTGARHDCSIFAPDCVAGQSALERAEPGRDENPGAQRDLRAARRHGCGGGEDR
jgi:hypothetical protein